jgi:hypothetical protein
MSNDVFDLLMAAVPAAERGVTAAKGLLRLLEGEAERFEKIVAREEAVVAALGGAAGQEATLLTQLQAESATLLVVLDQQRDIIGGLEAVVAASKAALAAAARLSGVLGVEAHVLKREAQIDA